MLDYLRITHRQQQIHLTRDIPAIRDLHCACWLYRCLPILENAYLSEVEEENAGSD
jgi:hypothetical protein